MLHNFKTPLSKFLALFHMVAVALSLAVPQPALAETIAYTLRWRPPTQGQVTSYRAYVGTASMSYAAPIELGSASPASDGTISKPIQGIVSGTPSYVVVTAVGPGGESVFSNEIAVQTQCTMSCDDRNPCTVDSCNAGGSCASTPVANGTICSDGNSATSGDQCLAGACVGAATPTGPSSNFAQPQTLVINGKTYCKPEAGEGYSRYLTRSNAYPNVCLPLAGTSFTQQGGGDVNAVPQCESDAQCDDSNVCNGAERCVAFQCQAGTAASNGTTCSDGNSATTGDQCLSGSCVGKTTPTGPSSGFAQPETLVLNGKVYCKPQLGEGYSRYLARSNAYSNVCLPLSGVSFTENGGGDVNAVPQCESDAQCGDTNVCNGAERCVSFQCQAGTALSCAAATGSCQVGRCDAKQGCMTEPAADGTTCNDGNSKTVQDTCLAGTCFGQVAPPPQCTTDANCGAGKHCSAGVCEAGAALTCEGPERRSYRVDFQVPAEAYTSIRAYVGTASMSFAQPIELAKPTAVSGVASVVIPDLATATDSYIVLTAVGNGGESPYSNELKIAASRRTEGCDSGNVCAPFICTSGVCGYVSAPNGTTCNDGNAATTGDVCNAGVCGKASTTPTTPTSNFAEPDTLVINGKTYCKPEAGEGYSRYLTRSKAYPNVCLPLAGTSFTQQGGGDINAVPQCESDAKCNDGSVCNGTERCVGFQCQAGTALSCAAAGVCQVGSCDAKLGCVVAQAAAGTTCDDGKADTVSDVCSASGSCAGVAACPSKGAPRTVRLSWTATPSRSITVLWDGPSRKTGKIRVRPVGGTWTVLSVNPTEVVDCEAHHILELTDLTPQTIYEYGVEYETDAGAVAFTDVKTFTTAPASAAFSGVYTSAFLASSGLNGATGSPEAARVIQAIDALSPNFVLGGGGYAYAADAKALAPTAKGAIEKWFAQLSPLASRAPWLPVYGETELTGGSQGEDLAYYRSRHVAFDRAAAAPGSYSFDTGATHYVALHAPSAAAIDPAQAQGAAQLTWLDQDLAAARTRGARFLVVYMHADTYSSHPAASFPETVRSAFQAVLDRHNVNLVLSGDTPGFERSHPVRAGVARPATGLFVDRSQGVVFVRTGSGGREDHLTWTPGAAPAWMALRNGSMKSFAVLHDVNGTNLIVEIVGIPAGGGEPVLLDLFVLL
jgi:hypothetical protein